MKSDIVDHLRKSTVAATLQMEIISCEEIVSLASSAGIAISFLDCVREKQLVEFSSGQGLIFCLARYQSAEEFRKAFARWALSLRNHKVAT